MSESLSQALARLRPAAVRQTAQRVGSWPDAEDLVQQALLKALEKQQGLRQPERLKPWFDSILRRTVADWWRGEGRRRTQALEPADEAQLQAPETADETGCACSLSLLQQLSAQDAELIRQSDLEARPVHEVAAELGLTPNNASVRLYRARRRLRTALARSCGVTSVAACQDCGCA
ncbi:MAG: RNA polymerase sigma factor [Candidatus Sericytochromatia bacterium]